MGHVFKRSSGQGWRMRQRSMELWKDWIPILNTQKTPLKLNSPLVQLADSEKEALFMQKLCHKRTNLGVEWLTSNTTNKPNRKWPHNQYGGLISQKDGRIDPIQLLNSLNNALDKCNVQKIQKKVINLERPTTQNKGKWLINLSNGDNITQDIVIICAALGAQELLQPLGYELPLSPVLGQIIELELQADNNNWSGWPAVLVSRGVNFIPDGARQILIGATLEPGRYANPKRLEEMLKLNEKELNWFKNTSIKRQWNGLRSRPINRPAPILEQLEPGLIIATGHYRNGILLAPATAEWVVQQITKEN